MKAQKQNTLHLNLHKKWFDMILSGTKKEEYRSLSEYWEKRLKDGNEPKQFDTITFSNGMKPLSKLRRFVVMFEGIEVGFPKKEWGGDETQECFILHLGNIIKKYNC